MPNRQSRKSSNGNCSGDNAAARGASSAANSAGVKYPAVLVTTGINDPRVDAWQAAKMAARLQAATTSGKPVLLRVDYDAGHGYGSTKKQRNEELADTLAFLLWQFGVKGFVR